jgi:hypothetical protein
MVMSNSLWVKIKKPAETREGRTLRVRPSRKLKLIYLFSVVVGHGATHHRRTSDDGKLRGGWSGSGSWRWAIQPNGRRCQVRQNPATLPCRSYSSARSIFAVTISPVRSGRRLET